MICRLRSNLSILELIYCYTKLDPIKVLPIPKVYFPICRSHNTTRPIRPNKPFCKVYSWPNVAPPNFFTSTKVLSTFASMPAFIFPKGILKMQNINLYPFSSFGIGYDKRYIFDWRNYYVCIITFLRTQCPRQNLARGLPSLYILPLETVGLKGNNLLATSPPRPTRAAPLHNIHSRRTFCSVRVTLKQNETYVLFIQLPASTNIFLRKNFFHKLF